VSVRVRIGVHTGSPQRHADGYVGMDVHRAARVAATCFIDVRTGAWRGSVQALGSLL